MHIFLGCDTDTLKTLWQQEAENSLERACSCQPAGHWGVKPSALSVVSFCSPACRGLVKSLLPEAVLCLWMRNPSVPFSHLLSVISGVSKAKQTPDNKKHWKCSFRPQNSFAVPNCQSHTQDPTYICGQDFLSSSQTLSGMLGGCEDLSKPLWYRALWIYSGRHQEQSGQLPPMSLHWRCDGDFPGGVS